MNTHTLLQAADIMIIIFLIYLQITPHTRKQPKVNISNSLLENCF